VTDGGASPQSVSIRSHRLYAGGRRIYGGRRQEGAAAVNVFRGINERTRALEVHDDSDVAFFVCECDDASCFRTVPLTADEYDELTLSGGAVAAPSCPNADGSRPIAAPPELAASLARRVAVPVRDVGLPVEGAPAG
jgi:hypothetical protein